jgi:hypothetical protein
VTSYAGILRIVLRHPLNSGIELAVSDGPKRVAFLEAHIYWRISFAICTDPPMCFAGHISKVTKSTIELGYLVAKVSIITNCYNFSYLGQIVTFSVTYGFIPFAPSYDNVFEVKICLVITSNSHKVSPCFLQFRFLPPPKNPWGIILLPPPTCRLCSRSSFLLM